MFKRAHLFVPTTVTTLFILTTGGVAASHMTHSTSTSQPRNTRESTVISGLNYPTAMTFDDDGNMYVSEGGGQLFNEDNQEANKPRILKVTKDNQVEEFYNWEKVREQEKTLLSDEVEEQMSKPITDLSWKDDGLYVTQGDRVSKIDPSTNKMSSVGSTDNDHWYPEQVKGPDGRYYYLNYGEAEDNYVRPKSGAIISSADQERYEEEQARYRKYLDEQAKQDWENELARRKQQNISSQPTPTPRATSRPTFAAKPTGNSDMSRSIADKIRSIRQRVTGQVVNEQSQYSVNEGNSHSEQAQSQEGSFHYEFSID